MAGVALILSLFAVAAGWKYLPFNKLLKVSGSQEEAFTNPQMIKEQPPNTLYFDFEIPQGKEAPGGFFKGIAHSGLYSVKAFGQNSYSVAIERKAEEVGVGNLKSVAVSAWVYVKPAKNEVTAALVFAVSNELGVNVSWQAVALREPLVPREKWFKVSGLFDLSAIAFKPGYKIQLYFWNNSRTDILVDDYFISFGGAPERHGDSTRVDLTLGTGYTPEFNYPPFPVGYLEKSTDGRMIPVSDIDPADLLLSGNFLPGGKEALLVVKGATKADLWCWCSENNEFRKRSLIMPQPLTSCGKITRLFKGRFIPGETDQFIIAGDKGYILGAIEPTANPCKDEKPGQTAMKLLAKSDDPVQLLVAGDFNGDHTDELLAVRNNGTWRLLHYQSMPGGGGWKVMAEDEKPVEAWVKGDYETGLWAGKFRPGNGDQLLAVSKSKSGKSSWTLLRLSPGKPDWEPVYPARAGSSSNNPPTTGMRYTGYTVGFDTLKPTDMFYSAGNLQPGAWLRLNRDWRFDLKEIRFNDSTYQVVQNIDFTGFAGSHNPKYYESLLLVPENLTGDPGFLVLGRIAKERNYGSILPDFNDLYHFTQKASK